MAMCSTIPETLPGQSDNKRFHLGVLTALKLLAGQQNKETVMNIKRRIWVPIAIAILSATASLAEVKTDYDRTAEFSRYKTYSWGKIHTADPLWVDRIKAAVNSALAAKGWAEVESGGDVSIMAMEMARDHRTLNTYYDNFGGGWGWRRGGGFGFGTSTTTEETYQVGTLVVDLFDTNTKKLIWRGSASDSLSAKSDTNIKKLNKDVQKMFDHFPPDIAKAGI